ncbi:nucleotidyltransferase domain-containing protein [Marinobacter mobilis]|uniref:nucleotidyltransferase domain-containing protein n=1 Tax=Marinobacter mobilis TaxID=488533 RepID=UPI0035C7642F
MAERQPFSLRELIAQCDLNTPISEELKDWEQALPVGLEQAVVAGQADIREAILVFSEKLAVQYDVDQLVLFGSRARGNYLPDSDADVAVILKKGPGDFVKTKLAMARLSFDVLLKTGVLIQALPVWECEWENPASYSNPTLLQNIAREGIVLWKA